MSEQQIDYFRRTDLASDVNVALARILEQKPANPRTVLASILARPRTTPALAQLYVGLVSANSLSTVAGAAAMGIEHEVKPIDMMKGEHKAPDFLALNPQGQVPALLIPDLGIRQGESSSILRTLANVFPVADHWYPIDPTLRFRVDWALDLRQTALYPHVAPWLYFTVGFTPDAATAIAKKPLAIAAVNDFLQRFVGDKFAAGDEISIADISIVSLFHLLPSDSTFEIPAEWRAYWDRVRAGAGGDVYTKVYQVLDDFVAAARERNLANPSFLQPAATEPEAAAAADPPKEE